MPKLITHNSQLLPLFQFPDHPDITATVPAVTLGSGEVGEAGFFVHRYGNRQFGHGFEVYPLIAHASCCLKAFIQQVPAEANPAGGGSEVEFYQFAGAFRQIGGGKDTGSANDLPVHLGYKINTARHPEAFKEVIGAFIKINRSGLIGPEFFQGAAYDLRQGFIIGRLNGSNQDIFGHKKT